MTATDELRRLLDERGVKWWEASPRKTKWNSPVLGGTVAVSEWNGKMVLDAGYVNVTPEQAIAATLGGGTCREVYLLMATDIGNGREEVLGVYATEEAAIAAINENQFGYALHHVRKWEVDA